MSFAQVENMEDDIKLNAFDSVVDISFVDDSVIKPKPITNPLEQFRDEVDGLETVKETGTVVFFDMGKTPDKTIYAFHNTAPKGSVIRVYNPGTGAVIFAKVLGPLPGIKLYHGAIMGVSSNAKNKLSLGDSRAWCQLEFAGY